ncbi:MAG: nucleoside kinase [Bacteroidales bacterium]|nr:nucleoside kinase [Bacteroidales bacterium]
MKQHLIDIRCRNLNTTVKVEMGTSLQEFYNQIDLKLPYRCIGALVNNRLEDLNFLLYQPRHVEFVDASHPKGRSIYLRTISMVLAKAVDTVCPTRHLRIEHPISKGYYCTLDGRNGKVDADTIAQIKAEMERIVNADSAIEAISAPTDEVMKLFEHQPDRVELLRTTGTCYTRYFRIDNFIDFFTGVLAPSTGYVPVFDLLPYANGFLLRVPYIDNPTALAPVVPQPKMFDAFDQFVEWNHVMHLDNVGDFDRIMHQKQDSDFLKVYEALHEKFIASIADNIHERGNVKIVMISGPSSSGKTTFSKRLAVQLAVLGIRPVVLSLDDYFVNREDTPKDENGEWDFEHLHAIDIELFNQQLNDLLTGKEVKLPTFNFEDGHRHYYGKTMQMTDDMVLIIEGIHALNPELLAKVDASRVFKLYVSALTTISLDDHTWLSTSDTRLIRRIVRDYNFRGFSARDTIARWPSVRRGEDRWIFPYQENADVMFNSSLLFELAVLRRYAEPLLSQVPQHSDEYPEAYRLLKFLRYFEPMEAGELPPTSLLREFLGGSSFRY